MHRHRAALVVRGIQRPSSSLRDSAPSAPPAALSGLPLSTGPSVGSPSSPRDSGCPYSAGVRWATPISRAIGDDDGDVRGETAVLAKAVGEAPSPCSGWGWARSRARLFLGVDSTRSSSCPGPFEGCSRLAAQRAILAVGIMGAAGLDRVVSSPPPSTAAAKEGGRCVGIGPLGPVAGPREIVV